MNVEAPRPAPVRLHTVDMLRGLAAFAVAFFHTTNGNPSLMAGEPLARLGEYGWLGVDVFFVISGFVIPYALERGGYHLRDAGRFLAKRIVRIDPPYFATIVLTLALGWVSAQLPSYRGQPFRVDGIAVLLHAGYLTELFGRAWVLPAFWTLALEFQFYLAMALLYPLVHHRRNLVRALVIAAIAGLSLVVEARPFVPAWGAWFALGILAHTYRAGRIARAPFLAAAIACGAIIAVHHLPVQGLVAAATALVIAFVDLERPVLALLGTLSYSLYLVHEPIGGRVVNLAVHYAGRTAWTNAVVVLVSLAVSIAAAWVMYRLVEGPSQRLSSRIRYAPAARGGAA
ncbi:MAG: acyltransferase [Gemmatimonadetes bacterium]|nr:acyltransferase [Gemmatimonadota bacterium]